MKIKIYIITLLLSAVLGCTLQIYTPHFYVI